VSPALVKDCLTYLQGINVTSTTLFPGIGGYCQSLENLLEVRNIWSYL
jgi:hypothetical protein